MSYGLRIENPSGILIMDAAFGIPWFKAKPALYRRPTGEYDDKYWTFRVQMVDSNDIPIVAIKLTTAAIVRYAWLQDWGSGLFEIGILSGDPYHSYESYPLREPTIYVFTQRPPPQVTSYGLRLFNAAGVCTFDSSYRSIRYIESIQFPETVNYWENQAQPITKVTNVAVVGDSNSISYTLTSAGPFEEAYFYTNPFGWYLGPDNLFYRYNMAERRDTLNWGEVSGYTEEQYGTAAPLIVDLDGFP